MKDKDKYIQETDDDKVKMPIVSSLDDKTVTDYVGNGEPTEETKTAETEEAIEKSETQALKEAIQEQAREDERPFSSNFTLRKILGGDILTTQLMRRQIWLIVLIVFFVILYISNRYSVQKDLLEIDRLNIQLKDAKYKALASSSLLTEKCRESHVLEMLKNNKDSLLKMPSQPPFIIEVPSK